MRKRDSRTSDASPAASETAFRFLPNQHPLPMWAYDLETLAILEVNDAAAKKYGAPGAELPAIRLKDLTPVNDIAHRIVPDSPGAHRHVCADGSIIDMMITSHTPRFNKRIAPFAIVTDITEEKRLQEALAASELRHRRLFESAQEGILILDGESGMIIDVNPFMVEMLGLSRESFLEKHIWDIGSLKDLLGNKKKFLLLRELGYVRHDNLSMETFDGRKVDVEFVSNVYTVDDRTVVQCNIKSIDARKKSERDISILTRAVSASHDVIFMTDREGIFTFVNPMFTTVYGHTSAEIVGKVTPRILKGDQPEGPDYRLLWETLLNKKEFKADLTNKRKDGTLVDIETTVDSIRGDDDEIIGFLAIQRDISERNISERELLASNTRHRSVLDSASVAIVTSDDQGLIFGWNAHADRLFGFSYAEALGLPVASLFSQRSRAAYADRLYALRAGSAHIGAEIAGEVMRGQRSGGGEFPLDLSLSQWDFQGIRFTTHILRDITMQQEMEEALRISEGHFRYLYQNAPNAYFSVGADGRISKCNQKVGDLLGCDINTLIGKSVGDLYADTPYGKARSKEAVRRAMAGERVENEELQMTGAHGTPIWVNLTVNVNRNELGQLVESRFMAVDITERRRTEEDLRWKTAFLRAQVDASLDGILVVDTQGKHILQNQRMCDLWKIPSEIAANEDDSVQMAFVIRQTKDPEQFNAKVQHLYSHPDERSRDEIELLDGTFLDRYSSPVRDKTGNHYGRIWTFRDITERKHSEEKKRSLEAQLLQAQKLESLGTLASGIAHDFNNILGIIMGHASLVERHALNRERVELSMAAITKAGQRGANMVKQMLTFARKSDVLITPVQMNEVVQEVAKLLLETFPKTVECTIHLGNHLPLIDADITQIHQVILNLCVNARDAMPDGGTLSIRTHHESGDVLRMTQLRATAPEYVVLSVADTGIGMNDATQQRIFEPFFTTKVRGKGTGLGLALVFGIMESHNGFVFLESEMGSGTTFHCCFPVRHSATEVRPAEQVTATEVPGGCETILLVEDEEMLRTLVTAILRSKGYTVFTAQDGEEAVALYRRHQNEIRLVLSDLGLPKFGGDDLYERLKLVDPEVLFILASGFIEPGLKSDILRMGVREFIPKPYSPDEVLRSIRRTLDAGRSPASIMT